jgi:NADPH:quinone reductase-like Zn-dependent oxidoreductase
MFGGPEVLTIEERPMPNAALGQVVIKVEAFGLNHAEIYFRQGVWGEAAEISGIECVGVVVADGNGRLEPGQQVAALVGGMGRSIDGSYAEFTRVPASNVVPINSNLPWEQLAAIPESYVTAWVCLFGNLGLVRGQVILVRGATSALGQAAVNIASHAGATVIGTTRQPARTALLRSIGASHVELETSGIGANIRKLYPEGIDAVLDLVGSTTILDSLTTLKRDGRACLAGFLGGGGPLTLEPVFQIPSGRHLSVLASALVTGGTEYPLDEVPLQKIIDRVNDGIYKASPARVFSFDNIREAHQMLEAGTAGGKLVVRI